MFRKLLNFSKVAEPELSVSFCVLNTDILLSGIGWFVLKSITFIVTSKSAKPVLSFNLRSSWSRYNDFGESSSPFPIPSTKSRGEVLKLYPPMVPSTGSSFT